MLAEVLMAQTREDIREHMIEAFGRPNRGNPSPLNGYYIGSVMMGLAICELDPDTAAELLGLDRRIVDHVSARAREVGILGDGVIRTGGAWSDPEHGAMNFLLDCMCIQGILVSVPKEAA